MLETRRRGSFEARRSDLHACRDEKILKQYNGGMKSTQIARALHLSVRTVRAILRRLGVAVESSERISEQAIELHHKGYSLYEIADLLDVNYSLIFRMLKKRLGPAYTKTALDETQIKKIGEMNAQGICRQDIAREFSVPIVTIHSVLKKYFQIERQEVQSPNEQQVIEMRAKGMTLVAISKELGINLSRVATVLRKSGVRKSQRNWTEDELLEIRKRLAAGEAEYRIASHFKVTQTVLRKTIVSKRFWDAGV